MFPLPGRPVGVDILFADQQIAQLVRYDFQGADIVRHFHEPEKINNAQLGCGIIRIQLFVERPVAFSDIAERQF